MTAGQLEMEQKLAWIGGDLAARRILIDAGDAVLAERRRRRNERHVGLDGFWVASRACSYLAERYQDMKLELRLAVIDVEWPRFLREINANESGHD